MAAWLSSGEGFLPGCPLAVSCHGGRLGESKLSGLPTLMTSSKPNYLPKNSLWIPSHWEWGLQYRTLGEYYQAIQLGWCLAGFPAVDSLLFALSLISTPEEILWGYENILFPLQPSPTVCSMRWWILPPKSPLCCLREIVTWMSYWKGDSEGTYQIIFMKRATESSSSLLPDDFGQLTAWVNFSFPGNRLSTSPPKRVKITTLNYYPLE